jgi:hypothetical protein
MRGFDTARQKPGSEREILWQQILTTFLASRLGDLDEVLIEGVKKGYFDNERITHEVGKLHNQIDNQRRSEVLNEGWDSFLTSFDTPETTAIDRLEEVARTSIDVMTIHELQAIVEAIKAANRRNTADHLIADWIDCNAGFASSVDLNDFPYSRDIKDPDVKNAVLQRQKAANSTPNLNEALLEIKRLHGWTPDIMRILLAASSQDYIELFKSLSKTALLDALRECRIFGTLVDPGPDVLEVNMRIRAALETIAQESPLNRVRLKYLGYEFKEHGTT